MSLPDAADTDQPARGRVVATNAVGPFHTGPISLASLAEDLVVLEQGDRALVLCRPPRDLNFCDPSDERL